MEREIVISAEGGEPQVAIMEDGQLVEIYIDRPLAQRIVGNIYKGRVENVLPGMQAAFVNVGLERNAFLFVDDAHPQGGAADEAAEADPDGERPAEGSRGGGRRPRRRPGEASISDLVQEGEEIAVQIVKEPVGTKGARVTRNLTLPGRFLVLVPFADHVGVSRRIQDEQERERLKRVAEEVRTEGVGVIVRTVAEGHGEDELREDFAQLAAAWERVHDEIRTKRAPALVYGDRSLVERVLRDKLNEHMAKIVVDDDDLRRQVKEYLQRFAPEYARLVRPWRGGGNGTSLFEAYGIDAELARALERRVWLKSGGYIVIDQTEAFTAIDVNTGRFVGNTSDLQDTVFRTNMEAAREIARQIRLRDIGGIIVIDFIDMEGQEHRRQVVQELTQAVRLDHSRPNVLGLTQLGLVEMTRKKGRQSLRDLLTKPCPYCDERGRVLTEDAASRKLREEIKSVLRESEGEAILVEVHPSVASLLIGPSGANLKELERETGRTVYIRGSEHCHVEKMNVRAIGDRRTVEAQALPVKQGDRLQVKVEEPHVANAANGITRIEGYVVDIEDGASRVGHRVTVEVTRVFRTYCKARIVEDA